MFYKRLLTPISFLGLSYKFRLRDPWTHQFRMQCQCVSDLGLEFSVSNGQAIYDKAVLGVTDCQNFNIGCDSEISALKCCPDKT